MSLSTLPWLDIDMLRALARQADLHVDCSACRPVQLPGWESLPGGFDPALLRPVGTLRVAPHEPEAGDPEPTLQEHHPRGTHAWSALAPIAPAFYPYNRCDVWQCRACQRAFLRYTEYGGYYVDARIRWLDAELIDASQPEGSGA